MKRLLLTLAMLGLASFAHADHEIGFIEKFALAADREAALKELIPGTEDYYFFNAVQLQNTGKQKELDSLMDQWAQRSKDSPQLKMIRNRQALLTYETDPAATIAYLKKALGVEFNHAAQTINAKPDLPTVLDQKLISAEAFVIDRFNNAEDVGTLTSEGVEFVIRNNLPLAQKFRRSLLPQVHRPDVPNLLELIAADLKSKESRGFGEFPIHQQLLVTQLESLAKTKPELMKSQQFIRTWLGKLRPNADVNLDRDIQAREAWLATAFNFVKSLDPIFNTLKGQLIYQRLVHDEKIGKRNEATFLEYLKLPRAAAYVNPKLNEASRNLADTKANLADFIGYPPVGNDEPLVRRYLLALLASAANADAYAPYVADHYLDRLLAEAKLTSGQGDPEKWFSLISPSEVQQLRERVDIEFDAANSENIALGQDVSIDAFVKNVSHLSVGIFEINTLNFYRSKPEQIGTDLNLDGLVANQQQSFDCEDAPILRVKRNFKFPQLAGKRGVWIVDFIGNGKSSRALIRKGQLHCLNRPSSAGTVITILDELLSPLPKATALVSGQEFKANEHGEIILPFSNHAGSQPVIVTDGAGFAQLETVDLQGETYVLQAGFHVPHESLISGRKATLTIRPTVTVNDVPSDVSLLEDVLLTIVSRNQDGTSSTLSKPGLKLLEGRETTVEFTVPERLAYLAFNLSGKVKSLLTGEKVAVAASDSMPLQLDARTAENRANEYPSAARIHQFFLSKVNENFVLQVLGKNGEPAADVAASIELSSQASREAIHAELKTNAEGVIQLGPLKGITQLAASGGAERGFWVMPTDKAVIPKNLHVQSGQTILLPWMGREGPGERVGISLLETRNNLFVRQVDLEKAISFKAGFLIIQSLEPGDYDLSFGKPANQVSIRVTTGKPASNFLVGEARLLEGTPASQLQILAVSKDAESLSIGVAGVTESTRVHVFASRFIPLTDAFQQLQGVSEPSPMIGVPSSLRSLYLSGRTLAEEYRYVLDRRGLKKFAGSLLPRPGLLLNPWAIRDTSTGINEARLGDVFAKLADGATAAAKPASAAANNPEGFVYDRDVEPTPTASINFLNKIGPALFNLTPDKEGKVTIKLSDIGDRQFLRILALDDFGAVQRDLALDAVKTEIRDLTLRNGLDPKSHFTRRNEVTILEKDVPLVVKDSATTQYELSSDLGKIFNLFQSLNPAGAGMLDEFRFILHWPTLDTAKKSELYSKNACHELSFFIQRKDPEFFKTVVLPYLANKRDRTFLDHYLLGDDLRNFLTPWKYARLNIVERILLAQRHNESKVSAAREVRELLNLKPKDPVREMFFFEALLGSQALSAEVINPGDQLAADMPIIQATPADPFAAPAPSSPPPPSGDVLSELQLGIKMKADNRFATTEKEGLMKQLSDAGGMTANSHFRLEQLKRSAGRRDLQDRSVQLQSFYRAQDPTKEWAENNYHHLLVASQLADLVTVNGFWNDYAAWDGKDGFLSAHVAEAAGKFTEMMFALSVLDLPFPSQAKDTKIEAKDTSLTITPSTKALLFHREIKPAEIDKDAPKLLVSQNFYRHGDRFLEENGEKTDKFVSEEFLAGVVYGCQVVVTNPTSSKQRLELLTQIPQGSIPVHGSKATTNGSLTLEPYRTFTQDFYFYFPRVGTFAQYPAHVSKAEKVVAFSDLVTFTVVNEPSKVDTLSWEFVSQNGSAAQALEFLEKANVHSLELDKIAWRMKDPDFFAKAIRLLESRHAYNATLWSYSLLHNDTASLREFLQFNDGFLDESGVVLTAKLVEVDPVLRHRYQHLEYSPLVNARAHRLGKENVILNDELHAQYDQFLRVLAHKASVKPEDQLAVVYYLLLQDRVEEAISAFGKVDVTKVNEKLQYDYLKAVIAWQQEDAATARAIATNHASEPVNRWREKFAELLSQLNELDGAKPAGGNDEDRDAKQNKLAATEPALDFTVESREIRLKYANVAEAVVSYYPMDLEFLFSTSPFVSSDTSRFSMIQPAKVERLVLPAGKDAHVLALPKEFHSSNVLVEIKAGGKSSAHAHYANDLNVIVSESQGRVQVLHAGDNRPLAKTYVKVFAEVNGQAKFYKDGYTDLRGKFDYLSLSTAELNQATRFSLLILSEQHGAAVREVKPPQQ